MEYLQIIEELKAKFPLITSETFSSAKNGTIHKVFISDSYVIRFRENCKEILQREKELIKQIENPLVPKVINFGEFAGKSYIIENRLPGVNLEDVWKSLSSEDQELITDDLIAFLKFLREQIKEKVYSVRYGKTFKNFYDYLTCDLDTKIRILDKYQIAENAVRKCLQIINTKETKSIFEKGELTLVHGDLIFHNLLTDKQKLTGVIDWERALWGDPDYDIFRLMNFQITARAYKEEGQDTADETGYLEKVLEKIFNSGLIKDESQFRKKYEVVKASYFLNAIYWDAKSDDPEKNISKTIEQFES